MLAHQGQYGDARVYCARAIREDDLLPEVYVLRGLILDMEGFLERALVEYQKVLWLEPAFVMAHYLSAKAYDRLAEKEKKRQNIVQLTVFPLLAERMDKKFNVFETLMKTLEKNNVTFEEGDVLVIYTKYISN